MRDDLHLEDECVQCGADLTVDYDEDHDMYDEIKREVFLEHCRQDHTLLYKVAATFGKIVANIRRFKQVVFR